MSMKNLFVLLILFFPVFTIFSEEETKFVSLSEVCENKKCIPRSWWVKDDFKNEYLSSDFQKPDSAWKEADKFPIWLNKFYSIDEKIHTYSLFTFFDFPESMRLNKKTLGLGFSEIGEVFEIYVNGNLIIAEGQIEDGRIHLHRTVRGVTFQIPREYIKEKDNKLLIKISGNPKFDHTGLYFTKDYYFGYFDDIQYLNRDFSSVVLAGIYIILGLYHLFLFIKRRKDKGNFYFGYWSFFMGVYFYTRTNVIFENHWDTEIIQRVELIVLYPFVASLLLFLEEMFFYKISKQGIAYSIICISLALPTILTPMHISEHLLHIWQLSTLFFGFPMMIYRLIQAIKNKIPNAKRILVALLIIISTAVFDILDSMIFNTGLSFTKYAFFSFVMMIMFILANKFVILHNNIEDLNATLEKKVVERTKELFESLERVSELKTQQDGDYFLTSLITEPLGLNSNKSKSISTQIYISQNKKFKFKKRSGELGGDICVTGNLRFGDLNNRYTMFFNGDAMGKSMQGAGGAIVAGTVINNIMSKSARNDKILHDITPDEWLIATFLELDNTFKTFDGSMLVSGVVGLISELTGEMLFFNAEHPNVVLLRDGIADFIDTDIFIRKFGTQINEKFQLHRIQLQKGDILFIGSDGKDDIRLGVHKVMNEDEKLFLKHVMQSEGNLDALVKLIESTGEIADDLSLLRITY